MLGHSIPLVEHAKYSTAEAPSSTLQSMLSLLISPPPSMQFAEKLGFIEKHFIDCGGTLRNEQFVNFQLWEADDFDHRLASQKLRSIIELAEKELKLPDAEIEVEYQGETIGKYGLAFNGISFLLTNKQTACLAEDACGIPEQKQKVKLSDLSNKTSCCDPKSGCC